MRNVPRVEMAFGRTLMSRLFAPRERPFVLKTVLQLLSFVLCALTISASFPLLTSKQQSCIWIPRRKKVASDVMFSKRNLCASFLPLLFLLLVLLRPSHYPDETAAAAD
jgi:hypothetical protein